MKLLLLAVVFLAGCASSPDVEKSMSRDKTMSNMAKMALIKEMLESPDPAVRLEGSRIAKEFVNPKKGFFDWKE